MVHWNYFKNLYGLYWLHIIMPIWNNALFGEKCNIGTSHIRSGGIAYPPMSPLWSWLKIWFIQPKFLHWVHYTPRLASIYPQVDSPVYEVCCIHWYISEHDMVLSCPYPLLGIGNSNTFSSIVPHGGCSGRYTLNYYSPMPCFMQEGRYCWGWSLQHPNTQCLEENH